MKRILVIITAALLLTTAAWAQRGMMPPPAGAAGPLPGAGAPNGDPVVEYLTLTADQKTAWVAAHEEFQTATSAIRDQIRTAEEQLKALMDARSTDAAAIGNVIITIRGLRDQIETAHTSMETKLAALLTADQQAKYAAFKAAVAFLQQRGPGGPGGPGGR